VYAGVFNVTIIFQMFKVTIISQNTFETTWTHITMCIFKTLSESQIPS